MRERASGIVCRRRFKVVDTLIFSGFGLMMILLSVITLLIPSTLNVSIQKSLPSWWFIFIAAFVLYSVSSPDLVISENGIEASILRKNVFLNWDQVVQVKRYKYYAVFEVKNLTPLNRVVGILIARTFKPSFSIAGNSTHYVEAMEFVQNKLGSRFVTYVR